MSTQSALSKNHPFMVAWEKYISTPEYANSLKWALAETYDDGRLISPENRKTHAEGAIWLAFTKGLELAASPAQPEKAKGCPECSNPLIPMLACSDFKNCSSLWHVDDPRITNISRPIEPKPTPVSKTEIDSFAEHLAAGISGFNNFKGKAGIIDWIRYQVEAWKAAQPLPAPPQSGKEGQP